jgi:DNA-binding transcriptional LysR family regulator
MQIRALENELGVTLLNHIQRQVSLTQAGAALLGKARHILARVEQAVLMTKRAGRGEIGELAIGFALQTAKAANTPQKGQKGRSTR